MRSWKRALGYTAIIAVAIALILPGLQAQSAATAGKFSLPFDAKLGKLSLPTGEYSFAIKSGSLNNLVYIYQGQNAVGVALPQSFTGHESQNLNAALVCVRHDGNVTVRALQLPNVGTFYFPLPKDVQTLVADQPELIETVSVQVTAY